MIANDEAARCGAFPSYVLLFATLYAGFGVMSPFLPALLQARGLRPEGIGLALALSTVLRLVSGPVAGRVADRLGALRSVFAACATAAAVCGLGFLPAHSFFQVVAIRAGNAAHAGRRRSCRLFAVSRYRLSRQDRGEDRHDPRRSIGPRADAGDQSCRNRPHPAEPHHCG
jgi:MFS family permease